MPCDIECASRRIVINRRCCAAGAERQNGDRPTSGCPSGSRRGLQRAQLPRTSDVFTAVHKSGCAADNVMDAASHSRNKVAQRRRRSWPRSTRPSPSPSTTRRKKSSTRSARSRRSATCRKRCTPGRSAASGTASPTSRSRSRSSTRRGRFERGTGLCAGGRRQLQRSVGRPRRPDLAVRRPQGPLSHRRLRRGRHRLGGRLEGQALEGRRRGRHALQPGRRRRRALQRRRPDVLALSAHLGLRDPERQLRAVHQRAEPAADGPPAPPDLGAVGLLHADAGHRLPDAVRPRRTSSGPVRTCWSGARRAASAPTRSS